jgi:hypothetical protein
MKMRKEYMGMWRFTEMSAWDRDFIDLVAPGHIRLNSGGRGTFAFGAIEADVDCRIEKAGTTERLAFSFMGWDEGDEISGRGWAEVSGNHMSGWIAFHGGDETTFKAEWRGNKGAQKEP